jgi:hypothetical protein
MIAEPIFLSEFISALVRGVSGCAVARVVGVSPPPPPSFSLSLSLFQQSTRIASH